MPFDLITIPCLSDNYAFLLRDHDSGKVAVVDVPEAGPIKTELEARGWTLDQVWLTHHHWDHIDGLDHRGDSQHRSNIENIRTEFRTYSRYQCP